MKPGRELDRLVAEKVMGMTMPKDDGLAYCEANDTFYSDIPHFSQDIRAAWEVVEKIAKELPDVGGFNLYGSPGDWNFEIDSNDGSFLLNGPSVNSFGMAKTAPHAICLAALRAKGVEV